MQTEQLIRRARGQQLADMLRRSAGRLPDKVALVFRDQTDTFAQLDAAVNRAANALAARGIAKGDRVALFTHNNRAFVVLRYALARLGAVTTPVNFMLTAPDVAYILDHSGARMMIAEDALCDTADAALTETGQGDMPRFAIPHAGVTPPEGWQPVADLLEHDDDPDDVHQRHRKPAQGRAADLGGALRAVFQLHHRRRDGRGRGIAALPAAVPLCAARLFPEHRPLHRRQFGPA
jgi:fatty-acyl-CoA synthase